MEVDLLFWRLSTFWKSDKKIIPVNTKLIDFFWRMDVWQPCQRCEVSVAVGDEQVEKFVSAKWSSSSSLSL